MRSAWIELGIELKEQYTMHTQLAVLGGGPGGYAAAFLAADLGMDVTLIEADPKLGGTCLLRGCIPSKALLHVAKAIAEARHMKEWGVSFDSPVIDINAVRARKQKVIDTLTGGLSQLAKKRNVRVVQARGFFEASNRMRLDPIEGGDPILWNCITYDHCVIAAGSRPAMPGMFDIGSDRVMDSTGALELKDIPGSLLVIGGGYIGLEMATVYCELGSEVDVVELTDGLLPGADRDLVKPLEKRIRKSMRDVFLNTKVEKLEVKGEQVIASFDGPDGKRQMTYDRVLVSVGRRPNSDKLGLENTQVKIDDRGFIVVDVKQRTADEHLLAIGDIAGDPMLAHKASHEGRAAVEALAGEPAAFQPAAIPAVVFTDPEIAWCGISEAEAKKQRLNIEVSTYPWAASGRAQAVGRTEGITKMIIDAGSQRVLGVGICGPGAGEMIAESVLAIEMGATVRDIAETIHPHPTMSETVGFSADASLGTATEIYRPKRAPKAKSAAV